MWWDTTDPQHILIFTTAEDSTRGEGKAGNLWIKRERGRRAGTTMGKRDKSSLCSQSSQDKAKMGWKCPKELLSHTWALLPGTIPLGLLRCTNSCETLQTAGPGVIRKQLREPITAFRQELQSSKCSNNQSPLLTLSEVPPPG